MTEDFVKIIILQLMNSPQYTIGPNNVRVFFIITTLYFLLLYLLVLFVTIHGLNGPLSKYHKVAIFYDWVASI